MSTESINLWKQRIKNRKSSGLKVDDCCNQNHISRHAYYYWYRKLKDMESEQKSIPVFEVLLLLQMQFYTHLLKPREPMINEERIFKFYI